MATFILVHGTFVKSAEWPALENGLIEVAKSHGENARIERISWSGANRVRAREEAAREISKFVQTVRASSPEGKLFLIGHSHGGSAIAYFLKNHSEAARIDGCAFLSTPFVAMRPRNQAVIPMLSGL